MSICDWYATFAALAGVNPQDPVEISDATHDIDGHNYWPAIVGQNRTNPRHLLPTTAWSLLEERTDGTQLKLMTGAYRSNVFLANGTQILDVGQLATSLPCIPGKPTNNHSGGVFPPKDPSTHEPLKGSCLVCSPERPCLFDVISDEQESKNLASQPQHVADVERLSAKLASYYAYVLFPGKMSDEELEPYECVPGSLDNNSAHTLASVWWHNYQGPCCRKR